MAFDDDNAVQLDPSYSERSLAANSTVRRRALMLRASRGYAAYRCSVNEFAVRRREPKALVRVAHSADHERDGCSRPGLVAMGSVKVELDRLPHFAEFLCSRRIVEFVFA